MCQYLQKQVHFDLISMAGIKPSRKPIQMSWLSFKSMKPKMKMADLVSDFWFFSSTAVWEGLEEVCQNGAEDAFGQPLPVWQNQGTRLGTRYTTFTKPNILRDHRKPGDLFSMVGYQRTTRARTHACTHAHGFSVFKITAHRMRSFWLLFLSALTIRMGKKGSNCWCSEHHTDFTKQTKNRSSWKCTTSFHLSCASE